MAVSLVQKGWEHLDSAARVARKIAKQHIRSPLPDFTLLNVNIPAVPFEAIQEMRVTRLGKRHPSEPVVKSHTPYGDPVYWIGPVGGVRSEEHTSELQSLMRISYAVFCLKKKKNK